MALDRISSSKSSSNWFSSVGLNIVTNLGLSKAKSTGSSSSSRTPSPQSSLKAAAAAGESAQQTPSCSLTMSNGSSDNKLKDVFRYFDRNGDGKVSAEELHEYFASVGESMSYEEAKKIIKELDSNGDGMLDFQEFVNVMKSDQGENEDGELRMAFEMFEYEKGSGCITPKGLQKMLGQIGDSRTYGECAAMISVFDSNRDGVLDFQEFRQMMTA